MRPEISIVTPVWNDGRYLSEAVESVRALEEVDWELILADDGSTDPATLAILKRFESEGIEVVRVPHGGAAWARNAAIRRARSDVILPLDADNRLRATFAKRALEYLEASPGVDIVYGPCFKFGEREEIVDPPEFDLDQLLGANFIDTCAAFRRKVWERTGGYEPEMLFWADWGFWLAAASEGFRFARMGGEVTFDYRVRENSLTSHLANDRAIHRALWAHVLSRHSELYRRRLPEVFTLLRLSLQEFAKGFEVKDRYIASLQAALIEKDQYTVSLGDLLAARDRELARIKAALASLVARARYSSREPEHRSELRPDALIRDLEALLERV
jgi:glycosyltransferase involved in cell wall biosynthesis